MKRIAFFTLFIIVHIGFLFLEVTKQMELVKESFDKQKNERTIATLLQKKEMLTNQLYTLQNKKAIKEFAQTNLGLAPVQLTQVKRLHDQPSESR